MKKGLCEQQYRRVLIPWRLSHPLALQALLSPLPSHHRCLHSEATQRSEPLLSRSPHLGCRHPRHLRPRGVPDRRLCQRGHTRPPNPGTLRRDRVSSGLWAPHHLVPLPGLPPPKAGRAPEAPGGAVDVRAHHGFLRASALGFRRALRRRVLLGVLAAHFAGEGDHEGSRGVPQGSRGGGAGGAARATRRAQGMC